MQATSHSKRMHALMQHTLQKGSADDIIATGASVAAGVPVCWMAMAASCMWLHVLAPSCNDAPAPYRPHTHARTHARSPYLFIALASSLIDLSILATKSVYINQLADRRARRHYYQHACSITGMHAWSIDRHDTRRKAFREAAHPPPARYVRRRRPGAREYRITVAALRLRRRPGRVPPTAATAPLE